MIRVYVTENALGRMTKLYVLREGTDGQEHLLRIVEAPNVCRWEPVVASEVATEPTFEVPAEIGQAMADALVKHFRGTTDVQTLREALAHERNRVDKLINVVSGVR